MQNMPKVRTVEKWHLLHMLWGWTVTYAEYALGVTTEDQNGYNFDRK